MIRVGVFFGGPSREREISFAGGKTACEHLSKQLFRPVPVFVDGFGRFVLLNPALMYEAGIRSFFPGGEKKSAGLYAESFPELLEEPIPAETGTLIEPSEFLSHFDFAFLAMHGPHCEDGSIQGLLEWYKVPYSGPGLLGSSVGIDKVLQNKMLNTVIGQKKATELISFQEWNTDGTGAVFKRVKKSIGLPLVLKAPHQGSSIGVSIVKNDDPEAFEKGVNQCFFTATITPEFWNARNAEERHAWALSQAEIESGIGYPVFFENEEITKPENLVLAIDNAFNSGAGSVLLVNADFEPAVLVEEFIQGQEFSCGCIQLDNDAYVALPPTEILKAVEVFDFNSKYKPGATRKQIPVNTTLENNLKIQETIRVAAESLCMDVCVRIDGFLTPAGEVILHDPNTVPGMSTASLIFKQMAEIGLNITQSLTYFIRQSLKTRIKTAKDTVRLTQLLQELDLAIKNNLRGNRPSEILEIAETEEEFLRAKAWYAAKSAEDATRPVVYLKSRAGSKKRLSIPMMMKDSLGMVLDTLHKQTDPLLADTRKKCLEITVRYGGDTNFDA